MKLSRVEIQGFKSFADRTIVTFDSDIVAIVGPNGCGKSNIADAIRWAMGEQSSKRLRAQCMENIVFSGSDTRGPMSMAEVILFFENDGDFQHPIYGSCSEISVTRRYFHAQDSAYLLNNVPCRRKDITDFLADAGASARIYSVVEQGRIGWIVMSKPEEKRALIEEAAGVSNYKDTINRTLRKMEKIRANLLRISDIIREMKSNLVTLRRQARKAERHNKYMEELKDAELWQASHLFLGLLQRRSAINANLESMRRRKDEVHRSITGTEAEMELLGSEVTQIEETLQELQDKLYRSENDSALLDANIDNSIREVRDIREKVQSDLEEIEKAKKKVHQCRGELAGLNEKRQELKERIERERDKLSAVRAVLETIKGSQAQQQKMQEENREKMVRLASNIAGPGKKGGRPEKHHQPCGETGGAENRKSGSRREDCRARR
ncbi:MAG: AAA family ATPase [Pseudomonadota bacterium]